MPRDQQRKNHAAGLLSRLARLTSSRVVAMIVNTIEEYTMARNKLAGKSVGKSRSAKYYAANPEARAKKDAYNTGYHATPERKQYRAKLNAANHANPAPKGQDKSHTKSGRLVNESRSSNRARNRGRK